MEKKITPLLARKSELEANIRKLAKAAQRLKRSPEQAREAFILEFVMGAIQGELAIVRNQYGRAESGYQIVQPNGASVLAAKLVSARDGHVLCVRDGPVLNPAFLISRPFFIGGDDHAAMREALKAMLIKFTKAYMDLDYTEMPYTR